MSIDRSRYRDDGNDRGGRGRGHGGRGSRGEGRGRGGSRFGKSFATFSTFHL